jgi:uncharacterized RDD family membrane protein YckC
MSGIFLSYRRDDSAGWAGRLYEHLVRDWGPAQVFIDIDAIAPGEDFREAIARTMQTCDVVVVVIGPNWVSARDREGNRRLDDEGDTHRAEVAAALAADVRVIPVLVGGADMPTASELPEPVKDLRYRNAAIIEDRRFASDARALMDALRQFAEDLVSRRSADEAAKRAAVEAARQADEAAKQAAEQEAARQADEAAKQAAEQEAARQADEAAKQAAEQEAARQADKAAKQAAAWRPADRPPPPPPPAVVQPHAGTRTLETPTVSRGNRFGAALIDAMILALLLVPALIYVGISPKEPCADDPTSECVSDAAAGVATGLSLLSLGGWSAYKIVKDGGSDGQTLGKRAVGIRVVDLRTGGSIGYPKAAGRTLLVIALLSCCWIIPIIEVFRRDPQQLLHDRIVGSTVVKT